MIFSLDKIYYIICYIMDIINYLVKIIDTIGYFGPQILFFTSIYLLFYKWSTLFIYFLGFGINILINIVLKAFIQQPRPEEDKRLFNLEILNGKRIGFDRYGMPSGHAEAVFFSTSYIFFVLNNFWISFMFLMLSVLTCIQRTVYKNHTISQVCVGGIIGIIVGWGFYLYNVRVLKGSLREKEDDNAPID